MARSVDEATALIQARIKNFGDERVPLADAVGRTLSEDLIADRPFPPFNRVMMDGIALCAQAFMDGQRSFKVEAFQGAGESPLSLQYSAACIETATGAVLPKGCDAVIMYEDLDLSDGVAVVNRQEVAVGQNVHACGRDRAQGELIVAAGRVCTTAEIGVAATVGKHEVLVKRFPRVALVSTGDELVPVDATPEPHQIRRSNVAALAAMLDVPATQCHLEDDRAHVKAFFEDAQDRYDLIVLCGAVSRGKRDYIPYVLEELGAEEVFHGVAQRPGKPLWFGQLKETVIFGLPGNPVSAFACGLRYVRAWIDASLGRLPLQQLAAPLAEDVMFKPALTYFIPVCLVAGQAVPRPGHGSGDLAVLVEADGFLELPADRDTFKAGELFPFIQFRNTQR